MSDTPITANVRPTLLSGIISCIPGGMEAGGDLMLASAVPLAMTNPVVGGTAALTGAALKLASKFVEGVVSYATNRLASEADAKAKQAPASADEVGLNHHLARLAGQALRTIIDEQAGLEPRGSLEKKALDEAAERAEEAWLIVLDAPSGEHFRKLNSARLTDAAAAQALEPGSVEVLTVEHWLPFAQYVLREPMQPGNTPSRLAMDLASRFEKHFARHFLEHAKFSADKDPAAFAALLIQFLADMRFTLRSHSEEFTALRGQMDEVITCLDALARDTTAKPGFDWSKLTKYLAESRAAHAEARVFYAANQRALGRLEEGVAELVAAKRGGSLVVRQQIIPTDLSRILKYVPAALIGRETEMALLHEAWTACLPVSPSPGITVSSSPHLPLSKSPRRHVLTFVALGGEGKTTLVATWAAELAGQDWPGCEAVFAWSFYSQGTRDQVAASSDLFLKEALLFFARDEEDKAFAASAASANDKGRRLARLVGERRALLILDGLEPLQYSPASPTPGQLKDQGIAALLKGLAASSQGLCLVTTRYAYPELNAFLGKTTQEVKLTRLSREAGVLLLKNSGVRGSELRTIPHGPTKETLNEFEVLVEDVKGHALTLQIMGGFLKRAFRGDIRQRDRVKFEKADEKVDGGHAFRAMAAYAQWMENDGGDEARRELAILRCLGLFDRPATSDCLHALLQPPAIPGLTDPLVGLAEDDWNWSLDALSSANLISAQRDDAYPRRHSSFVIRHSLDAHPHLREYFAKQLRENNPDAWRAAHRRLYEHLCATTKEGDQPTLEDLQPLYQAVAHGCKGGLAEKVCDDLLARRICRLNIFYTTEKLGAVTSDLGAFACFYVQLWSHLVPSLSVSHQAWVLNNTANLLRASGRLREAREPQTLALKFQIKQENWHAAGMSACGLGLLGLALGELGEAERNSNLGVECADKHGLWSQMIVKRVSHAEVLHQLGSHEKASLRFLEIKKLVGYTDIPFDIQRRIYGFPYCDLILEKAERYSWLNTLYLPVVCDANFLQAQCRIVKLLASLAFKLPIQSILESGLGRLALCRALFYQTLVGGPPLELGFYASLQKAIDQLRHSGNLTCLPLGLLTRAWFRSLTGSQTGAESAQEDLDLAWEIAERSTMKLFMADIHLHRARLFFRETRYPWNSPQEDLAEAEKLIKACGYHRRDEELADAKRALLGHA